MEVLLTFVLAAGFAAAAYVHLQFERARLHSWQAAARELGLDCSHEDGSLALAGVIGVTPVKVELARQRLGRRRGRAEEVVRFQVGEGQVPPSLSLRRDRPQDLLDLFGAWREHWAGDERIGDPEFDALVQLPKIDAAVCAALSLEARQEIAALAAMGGEIREGALVYSAPSQSEHARDWLVRNVEFMVQLAQLLGVTPYSLPSRLAHNAKSDPAPEVRLLNFHFLVDPKVEAPDALLKSTARALLADADQRVRLAAARFVPAEGSATLRLLLSDRQARVSTRVEALRILCARGDDRVEGLIEQLLGDSPAELAKRMLETIAERRLSRLFTPVLKGTLSAHESVRAQAVRTLAAISGAQCEPHLIRLLADESDVVRLAVAEALGNVGSVAAVEPLLPLTKGFGRGALRAAVRAALEQIRGRLGPVEPGWLSLAEPGELSGALAVVPATTSAENQSGELSLAFSGEEAAASSEKEQAAKTP